jgi:hypothetical protein
VEFLVNIIAIGCGDCRNGRTTSPYRQIVSTTPLVSRNFIKCFAFAVMACSVTFTKAGVEADLRAITVRRCPARSALESAMDEEAWRRLPRFTARARRREFSRLSLPKIRPVPQKPPPRVVKLLVEDR